VQTRSRRLPLVDVDSATGHDLVVSVLTQYRLLKFIAINVSDFARWVHPLLIDSFQCKESGLLHLPLRKLNIGTYVTAHPSEPISETRFNPVRTATMDTPVFDVVNMFSGSSISAVPIVDGNGKVLNLYETVDVIVRTTLRNSPDYLNHNRL
jgi:5'-AMP-activated protein kinase regulatory gamma subunit